MDEKEEMAVMEGVHFGLRDVSRPVLWFSMKSLHGSALWIVGMNTLESFLVEAGCSDITSLEGRPIVISRDGNMMRFVRFHK